MFYVKRSKCELFSLQIEYLGHIVLDKGILVDLKNVKVIVEWMIARVQTKMQSFSGFASYQQGFVKGFIRIATPLTTLLKRKTNSNIWTLHCDSSFLNLQDVLTPILTIMDDSKRNIILSINANDLAIDAILMQDK